MAEKLYAFYILVATSYRDWMEDVTLIIFVLTMRWVLAVGLDIITLVIWNLHVAFVIFD